MLRFLNVAALITMSIAPTATAQTLNLPWDAAFTPDGDMLYTEKCLGLSVVTADGVRAKLMDSSAGGLAPDYFCLGQSGMNGVVIDPDYGVNGNRDIYVFFSSNLSQGRPTNRVARLTLAANITEKPLKRVDIVDDIMFKQFANQAGASGSHSGGRLRFGLPGTQYENILFVTSGDNHNATLPQDLWGLGSKILAVNRDGTPFAGNVISPPRGDPRIFMYGMRNVQGIAMRPGTDQVYIAEHGPNHSDEVTKLVNGGNGGWDPKNRPTLTCDGDYCGYNGNATTMPMTDFERFPDAITPVWQNNLRSAGLTPCIFLEGAQWGDYEGWLVVGLMGGSTRPGEQNLVLLEISDEGKLLSVAYPTAIPNGRYRSLLMAPSGNLLVVEQQRQGLALPGNRPNIREVTPAELLRF